MDVMSLISRKLHQYYQVTKPGIIFGNLISAAGGFFLAAGTSSVDIPLLLATLAGLSLVVASGCAVNNCIDRDIDSKMARTRNRVTVTGEMSLLAAFTHGCVLGIAGFALLWLFTSPAATAFAAAGYLVYVGAYSLYLKRNSVYGTLIGSLSGAVPPVVGYCAVSGGPDAGALILLIMFSLWQMPHSYAIAIFRYDDYKAASIPVLPVVKGIRTAKWHIVAYILAFAGAAIALNLAGYAGTGYLVVACATSCWWLYMALNGYRASTDNDRWAKKVFFASIIIITVLSITMALDSNLPLPAYPAASVALAG